MEPEKISGLPFWFFLHRPIMILVTLITLTSFVVILADTNWKWVAASDSTSVKFTHSIFGIITVCLTIVQVGFIFF